MRMTTKWMAGISAALIAAAALIVPAVHADPLACSLSA
jgi:hypothetical protein